MLIDKWKVNEKLLLSIKLQVIHIQHTEFSTHIQNTNT